MIGKIFKGVRSVFRFRSPEAVFRRFVCRLLTLRNYFCSSQVPCIWQSVKCTAL